MSQTIEHDLSLLTAWTAEYDALDCGLSSGVDGTDESSVQARNFVLAQAAGTLITASDDRRRTPLDLLEAIRLPLDDLPA